uniref:Peptidase S1 domain-containing protein n=1 Tax=Glossina pallidipes TaxID=7398 RepID=A0A1A9ZPM3_GLOPL
MDVAEILGKRHPSGGCCVHTTFYFRNKFMPPPPTPKRKPHTFIRSIKHTGEQIYSEYSKCMTFYGYQKGEDTVFHAAAVLDNSVVITNYAQWLTDDGTDAFVVYGTPNITNVAADNLNKIKYKQVLSFLKPPFKPSDIQITLIKLEKGMKLDNEKSAKLPLSKTKYPLKGSRCFVVVTSTEDANRPSGTKLKSPKTETFVKHIEISLWTYNECKDYVKGINASQFCIRIHDSVDEGDHCKYVQAGSPVICNSRLTGIVNDMTPCKRAQPRPCTNIHPLKESISSNMREPKREAEKQEVSTEK